MSFYMKNEKRIYNIHFFVTITILPPPPECMCSLKNKEFFR